MSGPEHLLAARSVGGAQARPAHQPLDSRSHAVCRGQHPLRVDEGPPAEVHPVLLVEPQAHLPGPLAPRGLLPPNNACSLQGPAWGWGRRRPQDGTPPGPWAPLSHPSAVPGQGQGQLGLGTHQGMCGPGWPGGAVPADAASVRSRGRGSVSRLGAGGCGPHAVAQAGAPGPQQPGSTCEAQFWGSGGRVPTLACACCSPPACSPSPFIPSDQESSEEGRSALQCRAAAGEAQPQAPGPRPDSRPESWGGGTAPSLGVLGPLADLSGASLSGGSERHRRGTGSWK